MENTSQVRMQQALRKQQNEAFKLQQDDLNAAVASVDEALKILASFLPSPEANLIEMEKVDIPPDSKKELTKKLKVIKSRVRRGGAVIVARKHGQGVPQLHRGPCRPDGEPVLHAEALHQAGGRPAELAAEEPSGVGDEDHRRRELTSQDLQREDGAAAEGAQCLR